VRFVLWKLFSFAVAAAAAAMAAAAMTRAGGLIAMDRAHRMVMSKAQTSSSSSSVANRAFFGNVSGFRAASRPLVRVSTSNAPAVSVRAAEKYQVIEPLNGDPFVAGFETPVTSSPLIAWYLSNLPAYRTAVSPLLRGVEVGLAHGYLLVGPFVVTGPLRNTELRAEAGALGAAGLVVILTLTLTIYGIATFKEGAPSLAPGLTLTGRKKEADKLQTAEGWAAFAGGFFFGGLSGVYWAYLLAYVLNLPYPVK
jgi:photosystem I subunit 11